MKRWYKSLMTLLICLILIFAYMIKNNQYIYHFLPWLNQEETTYDFDTSLIPEFNQKDYAIIINDNKPFFTHEEITTNDFLSLAPLDALGRTGQAFACISYSKDSLPIVDINFIHPSGYQGVKYDKLIEDGFLYNRCHLIMRAFNVEGVDVKENIITGTKHFNSDELEGMLAYEFQALKYIAYTKNHIMYRVTPVYSGNSLLCKGVLMEAYSCEDEGSGLSFCVFIYNEQPGISINHKDGTSYPIVDQLGNDSNNIYVINRNSLKFHTLNCDTIQEMGSNNKEYITSTKEKLVNDGYIPCKWCKP